MWNSRAPTSALSTDISTSLNAVRRDAPCRGIAQAKSIPPTSMPAIVKKPTHVMNGEPNAYGP